PKMPITSWTMVIAGGALAALPPLAGFWSKDEIVGAAFSNGYPILWLVGLFTGGLTAFYIARAIWLTFHGQPRDRHLFEHAHESPRVMTVPLLALAIGTVLAGVIGIPPDQGFIHSFLAPSVETAVAEHVPPLGTIVFLALASVIASVIGIAISLSMYARGRPDPAAVARASGPYYRILVNKYYVDELYDHRFVYVARADAGLAWSLELQMMGPPRRRAG